MRSHLGKALLLVLAVPTAACASKLPTVLDGYVTHITSPSQFEMGVIQVNTNAKTDRIAGQGTTGPNAFHVALVPHVGSWLQIQGKLNPHTDVFLAHSITFLPQPGWKAKPGQTLNDVALIEETPELRRDAAGVTGALWVDGYPLHVTPSTKLLSEDGKPIAADQIRTNMWADFQAQWQPDHSLQALSIRFWPNTIDPGKTKFSDMYKLKIQPPDYAHDKPGTIQGHIPWKLKILPDKAAQDYVTQVGESLIPAYQKELPSSDPSKIHFRFYVVEKTSVLGVHLADCEAFPPSGIIVVPDSVLSVLDNDAQLAALLSNCIAITLNDQVLAQLGRLKKMGYIGIASEFGGLFGLPVLIPDAIAAHRLGLRMNERASRVGLRYMLHAGYDIREAPFAWTVAKNQKAANPQTAYRAQSALTQSLMAVLYSDYASTDYASLKTNRAAYQQMLTQLRSVTHKLPKPKNPPWN